MQNSRRQLAIVAVATLVGLAVLAYGLDDREEGFAPASNPTPTPTAEPSELPAPTPTPDAASPGAADPASVTVLVANSTGVDGLAGTTTTEIANTFGYSTLDAVDSTGPALDTTVVYFVPGFRADAEQLAASFGLGPSAALAMPAAPPVDDLGTAQLLVVLGTDQAPSEEGA